MIQQSRAAGQGYAVPPGVESMGTMGEGSRSRLQVPAVPLWLCGCILFRTKNIEILIFMVFITIFDS
jgi:hypothetical protein